jgi:hypothetical protein
VIVVRVILLSDWLTPGVERMMDWWWKLIAVSQCHFHLRFLRNGEIDNPYVEPES